MKEGLFMGLPVEVREEIKDTLRAYDRANVRFVNGKFEVTTGTCLQSTYEGSCIEIGEITSSEVFTENERIENYINTFKAYPTSHLLNYTGKQDWKLIEKMSKRRFNNTKNTVTEWVGKLNEKGDFELTEKIVRNL